jgi:predicted phage-related endonuclease
LTNYVKPYFAKIGYEVGKPKFMMINSDFPFFRANVDGIAFKKGDNFRNNIIVEIKWVSECADKNWYKPEYCGIPASYYAQVQLYMLVTGAQEAIVCALFDKDWDMNYFNVPRDEAFIKNMIEVGSYFYQYHMLMKMPPRLSYEVDKDEVTTAIKKAPTTLSPSDEMTTYIEKYLSNGEKIKKAEEIQSQLKDLILDLATKGYCPSNGKHSAKISVVKTTRLSSTKVKEAYPEIYEQCCEESESPRLTIK